ncbi:M48 family metallopeptidase [uncultured Tateyamaria sp.]|uniref:M48 family metallopeptidase n=1 Tax=uncultured Tateyamaria sp. TaxID=455651 RepID=UPI00262C7CD4|nr:M48 family metallopeptidase [uncultured Tateyamaria sp.]
MTRLLAALTTLAFVAACDDLVVTSAPTGGPAPVARDVPDELRTRQQSTRAFAEVVRRVEPVAERECKARTQGMNCDFKIVVDDRANAPSNAFQTLDDEGRPILVFTLRLIDEARNADELAFVMGHEAAHHVSGHIARQRENAAAGAVIFGGLATLTGGDPNAIESAQRIGAQVGARTYSKDFELEADALGTVITAAAGYDPVNGAEFFNRIPDPGDRFLGTHPPNAQRIETVRRTAAGL